MTDKRFFIRSIIGHHDLVDKSASLEYMIKEGERTFLEALDYLELFFTDPKYQPSDCNHIFLHVIPTVIINPLKVI